MIVEIIFFDLPAGTDQSAAFELYQKSAQNWLTNPDLIEKYYFFDEARCLGGGIYIWPSREVAARWHGREYEQMIAIRYGSKPRIQVLDALLHIVPDVERSAAN
jgi:hypothetical protein